MLLTETIVKDSAVRYRAAGLAKRAARKAPPDGSRNATITPVQKRGLYTDLLAQSGNPAAATRMLERIIAGNDLTGINYLALGVRAGRAVGRVHLLDAGGRLAGYGTGFLVAPGVLMTNNHVLTSDIDAKNAFIEFDYELDIAGRDRPTARFAFLPAQGFITNKKLDFSIVAVALRSQDGARSLSDYGYLPLRPRPGKSFEGEYLTIIQHPGGERKQICVRENKLLKYLDDTIWYQTDTVAGSSGSPVFNGFWEVVALHHSGIPDTNKKGQTLAFDGRVWDQSMGDQKIKWIANEGIRISRIAEYLRANNAGDAIARTLLAASTQPQAPETTAAQAAGGTIIVNVPVPIQIHFGAAPPVAQATNTIPQFPDAAGSFGVEKVEIDQSDIDKRPGYDENFLGKGVLRVPLPALSRTQRAKAVKRTGATGADAHILRYYNYSLAMNGERRLAFYSAVNIDGASRRDTGKRDGDKWFLDPRIPEKFQIGESFYADVKIEEADRVRVFDRGHLVRRLDSTWGATEREAKRNGDDTFHFTNCSPQHYKFNQGTTLWAGIEDFVLFHAENEEQRACVINGPIFRADDKKREGVLIPQQFFKIAVFVKNRALAAAGFVLSQADLLAQDLPGEEALRPLAPDKAAAFQMKISTIAKMTGLDFAPLAKTDSGMHAFEGARVLRPLESFADIAL